MTASISNALAGLFSPAVLIGGRFLQNLVQRFNHTGIIHSLTPSLVSFSYVQR